MLGVDYGQMRTGVATCDPGGLIATGIKTLTGVKTLIELSQHIIHIGREHDVCRIVLGLPLNMDDSEGPKCLVVRELAQLIEQGGYPVILWDERCTTVEAQEIMQQTNTKRKKRKNNIDALAAQILLQDYLDNGEKQ